MAGDNKDGVKPETFLDNSNTFSFPFLFPLGLFAIGIFFTP